MSPPSIACPRRLSAVLPGACSLLPRRHSPSGHAGPRHRLRSRLWRPLAARVEPSSGVSARIRHRIHPPHQPRHLPLLRRRPARLDPPHHCPRPSGPRRRGAAVRLLEAILGALLVELGYTAQSRSALVPARPAPHQHSAPAGRARPHRALARPPQGLSPRHGPPHRAHRRSGPARLAALGDTLFPASS